MDGTKAIFSSAGSGGACLFMALLLLGGCGPGSVFDERHYDCTGADKKELMAAIIAGTSVESARTLFCKEIFPPCGDSTGTK
jgi:hypothetical protein